MNIRIWCEMQRMFLGNIPGAISEFTFLVIFHMENHKKQIRKNETSSTKHPLLTDYLYF